MPTQRQAGHASRGQGPHPEGPEDHDPSPAKGPPGLYGNPNPHAPHDPEDKPPGTVKPRSDEEGH